MNEQSLAREVASHQHAYREPDIGLDTSIPSPSLLLHHLASNEQCDGDEGLMTVNEYNSHLLREDSSDLIMQRNVEQQLYYHF
ncbi:hypothetical protein EB796_008274 [Bugula neritina]|uniref:Uncharacterized protein n=1 Tax=Bugula neritina TaxID=10212 RepID=A0A7J7K5E1_BUGNE|nr:hypothetical protein EB796_008274 [Bugula neritina]